MSVMKCARNRTTCARSVVQCYASCEERCGIVLSVVISVCVIELCPRFPHCRSDSPCCDTVKFISLVSRSHFSHMCSLYSHGFLGVVFTDAEESCQFYAIVSQPKGNTVVAFLCHAMFQGWLPECCLRACKHE